MNRKVLILVLVVVIVFIGLDADAQCSMCKASVESSGVASDKDGSYGRGINNGILYLMAFPYILLAFFFRKHIFSFFKEFRSLWNK